MLLPDIQIINHYLQYKKNSTIQQVKVMIAKIFDNYTDGLIDAFKRETHNSVFTIDTYEHWDNIDGKPMVRIKFMHDPMVYVSHGIQAQYIHAMYTNI